MENQQIEIGSIPLKAGEKLVISSNKWRETKFVDVRIWYRSKESSDNNGWKPTKKGVRLSYGHYKAFLIEAARAGEIIADCE